MPADFQPNDQRLQRILRTAKAPVLRGYPPVPTDYGTGPLRSLCFTSYSSAASRLQKCADSHAHNIGPPQSGNHVNALQCGLSFVAAHVSFSGRPYTDKEFWEKVASIHNGVELTHGVFGTRTMEMVKAFKNRNKIVAAYEPVRNGIVGVKTIRLLDSQLKYLDF